MSDLPRYITDHLEIFSIIGLENFQETCMKALQLKDKLETIKKVVERYTKNDKIDKVLINQGINPSEIEIDIKMFFNDLQQKIINKVEVIRERYKGIEIESLDEDKYCRFRAMTPDKYDNTLLDYMVSYIKSSKEKAEETMKNMLDKLTKMIEDLVNKKLLDATILNEIRNIHDLSKERILYLENYIINNLYNKGINVNGALKKLLDEVSKVSNRLGIESTIINGKNVYVSKIINEISKLDISNIRINQNDIKEGMKDSEKIYEFFMHLKEEMDRLGLILVEIYNNKCVREKYGELVNLTKNMNQINAMMNQRIYDIDGEIAMIINELRNIENIECEESSGLMQT
jgi:hypothetical protein